MRDAQLESLVRHLVGTSEQREDAEVRAYLYCDQETARRAAQVREALQSLLATLAPERPQASVKRALFERIAAQGVSPQARGDALGPFLRAFEKARQQLARPYELRRLGSFAAIVTLCLVAAAAMLVNVRPRTQERGEAPQPQAAGNNGI